MKLYPKKGHGGHVTGYFVHLGSKEARDAGFLNADGSSKELKKTIDAERGRIIIELVETEKE